MTPEKQRIAIAKACGAKNIRIVDMGSRIVADFPRYSHRYLPDYPNDLNAMHEAEKVIGFDEEIKGQNYRNMLFHLVSVRPLVVHASASHRAEAFLKVLGRWKDRKPQPSALCHSTVKIRDYQSAAARKESK